MSFCRILFTMNGLTNLLTRFVHEAFNRAKDVALILKDISAFAFSDQQNKFRL